MLIYIWDVLGTLPNHLQRYKDRACISWIWATYDVDNSGALDKEETKKFIKDTLGSLPSDNGGEFSEEAFGEVFATFDKDGSGTIEKGEMVTFIKQLLGGNWAWQAWSK